MPSPLTMSSVGIIKWCVLLPQRQRSSVRFCTTTCFVATRFGTHVCYPAWVAFQAAIPPPPSYPHSPFHLIFLLVETLMSTAANTWTSGLIGSGSSIAGLFFEVLLDYRLVMETHKGQRQELWGGWSINTNLLSPYCCNVRFAKDRFPFLVIPCLYDELH